MSDFKIIETQEQLDQVIKDRLERERVKLSKEYEEKISGLNDQLKTLTEENSSVKQSLEKIAEKDKEIDALKGQVAGYEKAKMRTDIALQYNIPYNLSDRIQGDDEEAMKKDAESLAKYFQKAEPIAPPKEVNQDKKGDAYQELLNNLNLND